ncbi:MAG: PspC domain-containing protein [Pseudomonadales bacterium]
MTDRRDRNSRHDDKSDLQRAMTQLEDAIQDLVRSARDDWSDRATSLLDETTRRIRGADEGESRSRRYSDRFEDVLPKSRKLFKDPYNRRIAGVCAGFARYFGVETWVVRLLAVTGLLFMPGITLPGYLIACLLMDKPGRSLAGRVDKLRTDHRSPAPEFGARHAPRRSLRQVHADLTDAELKLRRIETHVTSDQYALRRELDALDRGAV